MVRTFGAMSIDMSRMQAVIERVTEIRERFGAGAGARAAPDAGPTAAAQFARRIPGQIGEAIAKTAGRHGLDPAVLGALAQVESGLRPDAVSPDGAMGIAQLMPGTAARLGVTDPFDLEANLDGGARYLKEQVERFAGDLPLALAAYNAGPGAVTRYGGIPPYPETRRFVARVLELANAQRSAAP